MNSPRLTTTRSLDDTIPAQLRVDPSGVAATTRFRSSNGGFTGRQPVAKDGRTIVVVGIAPA